MYLYVWGFLFCLCMYGFCNVWVFVISGGKQGLKADTELACTGMPPSSLFTKFYTSITDKDCSGVTVLV